MRSVNHCSVIMSILDIQLFQTTSLVDKMAVAMASGHLKMVTEKDKPLLSFAERKVQRMLVFTQERSVDELSTR